MEMYSSDYLAKSLGLGDNIGNYFIYKNSGGGTRPDLPHLKKKSIMHVRDGEFEKGKGIV